MCSLVDMHEKNKHSVKRIDGGAHSEPERSSKSIYISFNSTSIIMKIKTWLHLARLLLLNSLICVSFEAGYRPASFS